MLSVVFIYCYAECRYDECHYTESHYAECHYAECGYAESRGAFTPNKHFLPSLIFYRQDSASVEHL
jgi:hypothetical protein